jgi:hypothetical protein
VAVENRNLAASHTGYKGYKGYKVQPVEVSAPDNHRRRVPVEPGAV